MSTPELPDLSAHPDARWGVLVLGPRGGSYRGGNPSVDLQAGTVDGQPAPMGVHLVSDARPAVLVPLTGALADAAEHDGLLGSALARRAARGGPLPEPDWCDRFVERWLAARDGDFAALFVPVERDTDEGWIESASLWHDSDPEGAFDGPVRVERDEAGRVEWPDLLDAVLATGTADIGLALRRTGGEVEARWTPAADAIRTFQAWRNELLAAVPTPALLRYREHLAATPAPSWPGEVVVARVNPDFDPDLDETQPGQGEVLASVPAVGSLWVRQTEASDQLTATDVLLLAPDESAAPGAVAGRLLAAARPLGGFDADAIYIGPALTGDEAERRVDGPLLGWGEGLAFGDPDFGQDALVGTDGRNLFVGEIRAVYGVPDPGEWVRAEGR